MSPPIDHLVVDSSAFIHHGPMREKGQNIYVIQEVLDEIKDEATLNSLGALPLKMLQFTDEDLEECIKFSKKTGDYKQLSAVDLKLIAATYRLEKQFSDLKSPKQDDDDIPEDDEEQEGWITPQNVSHYFKKMGLEERVSVACMTSDFSIQNCLLQMGMHVISPIDGLMIKEAKKIALRCHACFKVFLDPGKIKGNFCPHCGNLDTLKRVQYIIDANGEKKVLINFKRPIKVKGTNQQLPRPRGGKHANNPILTADQKVRKDKQDKFFVNDKKTVTPDHILNDPAYLVRTNPFTYRNSRIKRR